jgi:hypothetical protein
MPDGRVRRTRGSQSRDRKYRGTTSPPPERDRRIAPIVLFDEKARLYWHTPIARCSILPRARNYRAEDFTCQRDISGIIFPFG